MGLMNAGAVAKDLSDLGLDILYDAVEVGGILLEDFLAAGAITYYLGREKAKTFRCIIGLRVSLRAKRGHYRLLGEGGT